VELCNGNDNGCVKDFLKDVQFNIASEDSLSYTDSISFMYSISSSGWVECLEICGSSHCGGCVVVVCGCVCCVMRCVALCCDALCCDALRCCIRGSDDKGI
jgi:hypothetical protein